MKPDLARDMFGFLCDFARKLLGDSKVQTGAFGEKMEVELVNDGPVTIVLDQNSKTKNHDQVLDEE